MAEQIGFFTPEQARELWQDYQTRKQLQPQLQQNFPRRRDIDEPSPHRVFVKNATGLEAPPFACMQVTGTSYENGMTYVVVRLPEEACGEFVFNGQFPIPPGGYGWAYAYGQVRMLGSGEVEDGCKRAGPAANSWAVAPGEGPFVVYGPDGSFPGVARGRIVGEICKARWIQFKYSGGGSGGSAPSIEVDDYWDGVDPSDCGEIEVIYPLGEPCPDEDVIAFWDPNDGKYVAISTKSAMLGEPVTKTLILDVENESCGIKLTEFEAKVFKGTCEAEDNERDVELGESMPVVASISSESCGHINYAFRQIRAFPCDSTVQFTDFPIDFGSAMFVTAAEFGPPDCPGNATWTFNTGTNDWDLTTACPNGCTAIKPAIPDPLPTSAITTTTTCDVPASGQCGLNLTLGGICVSDVSVVHVPLELTSVDVVTEVVDTGADLRSYRKRLYVCNVEDLSDDIIGTFEECEEPE
jgi:hypothetical protein